MLPILFDEFNKFTPRLPADEWKHLSFREKKEMTSTGLLVSYPGQNQTLYKMDDGFGCHCSFSWVIPDEGKDYYYDNHDNKLYLKDALRTVNTLDNGTISLRKKYPLKSPERDLYNPKYGLWAAVEDAQWVQSFDSKENTKINKIFFDIETETVGDGRFADANRNPIFCIGYAINDGPIEILDAFPEKRPNDRFMDKDILKEFIDILVRENIDIIVGYNNLRFDIPYLIKRYEMNNLPIGNLPSKVFQSGEGGEFFRQHYLDLKHQNTVDAMLGYIHYDIWVHSVQNDQTLTDLKNRKMKTLGEHFNITFEGGKSIKLEADEIGNTRKMVSTPSGKESFLHYLRSDINLTRRLCDDIYFTNLLASSEMEAIPLHAILHKDRGTLPTVVVEKECRNRNIIPVFRNYARRHELFENGGKQPYQGAYVAIFQTGYKKKVWKLDYSGMYPASIRTLNLSPETIRIMDYEDWSTKSPEDFLDISNYEITTADHGGSILFKIPDSKQKRRIHLKIAQNTKGIVPTVVENAVNERKKWKELAEKYEGTPEEATYTSYSWYYKILANSIYGIMGNENSSVGDILIAMAITGFCRYLTLKTIEVIGKDKIIEIDTDGFLLSADVSKEEVNKKLDEFVQNTLHIPRNYMFMDKEEFGRGYFNSKKNYILEKYLRNENKEIIGSKFIKHGVTFKSSNKPKLYDRAIDIMIDFVFNQELTEAGYRKACEKAHDFSELEIGDFEIAIKIKKLSEYDKDSLSNQHFITLADQTKNLNGEVPNERDTISFVYNSDYRAGVCISDLITDKSQINMDKYSKIVDKAVELLDIDTKLRKHIFTPNFF